MRHHHQLPIRTSPFCLHTLNWLKNIQFIGVMLLIALTLTGCNSPQILQDSNFNPPVYFGSHTVEQGDTLYSIAWRYGRDYKELAEANKISPPYSLLVGQRIRLDLKVNPQIQDANSAVTKRKPILTKNNKQTNVNKGKIEPVEEAEVLDSILKWRWPHVGPVIATFSSTGAFNKGIDIGGKTGDSVVAAAEGEVVYAGSGLRGYGKLVIVSHANNFISAYAHNQRILVKEGDRVKAGQRIAELGESGTTQPKLHFEIRQKGKPVDPEKYLPAKK